MRLVFRLRPEYDDLCGATIISPPNGTVYDVVEQLKEGDGKIDTTDDEHLLQGALISLHGAHGALFNVTQVNEEGEESPYIAVDQDAQQRSAPPMDPRPIPTDTGPREAVTPPVDHQKVDSEYERLPNDELKALADSRGLEFHSSRPTKTELVAALEQSDAEGAVNDEQQ